MKRPGVMVPAVILCVATLLRFWHLDAIEHNVDHAYPIYQALRTLEQGHLPVTGQQTSVLFANPALAGYLYLPVLLIWRSPTAAYLLVIALNTLGVWLAYRAVRALLGEEHAWIAAALMAVNPWVIEYSRATWVQGLVPFFACLVAFWLWPVLAGKSARPGRDTIAALVALTLLTQTYLPAFVIVLPVGVLLVTFRRRVPWRAVMAGGLIFTAATGVYVAGLLSNWEHTRARIDGFLHSENKPILRAEAWEHAVRLVNGAEYATARGTGAPTQDAERRQALSEVASAVLGLALAAGAVTAVWASPSPPNPLPSVAGLQSHKGREDLQESGIIALVWVVVPLLTMTWVSQPVHAFYLLITLPGGYALAALGLGHLLHAQRVRRAGAALLAAGGVALAVLFGINSARYYAQTRAFPGDYALGALPLGEGLRLGATINVLLEDQPERFLSIDEDPMTIGSLCGRLTTLSRDQRFPALTRVVPWPGGVTVVFDADGGAPAPVGAALIEAETINLRDGTAIRFYRHARAGDDPAWLPEGGVRVELPTDRGLTLMGWAWTSDARLTTYWRVDSLPADYGEWLLGPGVHAFDGEGHRTAVIGGEAVPGYEWRVGQLYVQQMTVPGGRESAAYFEVGLYDAGRGQGAMFLPAGGEPMAFYRLEEPRSP